MNNYNSLKPGTYIQRGDSIKSLSLLNPDGWNLGNSNPSAESLAASVGWVYIALNERRSEMDQIAEVTKWVKGETEYDMKQLGFSVFDELPRADQALQLHSRVYYHKTDTRGGFMLEWLDPASMKPDESSYNAELRRYDNYKRTVKQGNKTAIVNVSADKLIIISLKGMRELAPGTSAAQATSLAAQVMKSMDATLDDFFDHNALPMVLISVPPGTSEPEKLRLQNWFGRQFDKLQGSTNKSRAISADVSVTTLSLAPDQLELTSIRNDQADTILLAHGVPVSVRQSVNKAEAGTKSIDFTRRMVGRAQMIARKINEDPDVKRSGFSLKVNAQQLDAFQLAELLKAEALQRLTGGPVISVNEARERLDLEPAGPQHDEIIVPQQGFGMLPSPSGAVPDDKPSKAYTDELKALHAFIGNGNHNKRWFKSNELSDAVIMAEITKLDPTYGEDIKKIATADYS